MLDMFGVADSQARLHLNAAECRRISSPKRYRKCLILLWRDLVQNAPLQDAENILKALILIRKV